MNTLSESFQVEWIIDFECVSDVTLTHFFVNLPFFLNSHFVLSLSLMDALFLIISSIHLFVNIYKTIHLNMVVIVMLFWATLTFTMSQRCLSWVFCDWFNHSRHIYQISDISQISDLDIHVNVKGSIPDVGDVSQTVSKSYCLQPLKLYLWIFISDDVPRWILELGPSFGLSTTLQVLKVLYTWNTENIHLWYLPNV